MASGPHQHTPHRSASLCLNLIATWLDVNEATLPPPAPGSLAREVELAVRVENAYVGSPCGNLDQIMIWWRPRVEFNRGDGVEVGCVLCRGDGVGSAALLAGAPIRQPSGRCRALVRASDREETPSTQKPKRQACAGKRRHALRARGQKNQLCPARRRRAGLCLRGIRHGHGPPRPREVDLQDQKRRMRRLRRGALREEFY